ncbi:unnamed protein product, partial [marine sediment metagenome]
SLFIFNITSLDKTNIIIALQLVLPNTFNREMFASIA